MNFLKNSKCYLSGAIEHDNSDLNWRTDPVKHLTELFGIDIFDPFADPKQQWVPHLKKAREECNYEEMARIADSFVHKDLGTLDRSDFLIAYLPKNIPTVGTHHEIISANHLKRPTLLVCPEGKNHVPLWYYGFIPHEFMFGGWEELYDYLREVDDGKHKNNKRWRFVYKLV